MDQTVVEQDHIVDYKSWIERVCVSSVRFGRGSVASVIFLCCGAKGKHLAHVMQ